jgi:hypothetical protein
MDIHEQRALPFPQRVKLESAGICNLSKELAERERKTDIGIMVQIVKTLGRPITDKEMESMNI